MEAGAQPKWMSWGAIHAPYRCAAGDKAHFACRLVNGCIQGKLKEAANAGYIALDDLTRMGNIIRSRTFDAYTPFIVVAIIYFYTTTILSLLQSGWKRG